MTFDLIVRNCTLPDGRKLFMGSSISNEPAKGAVP